MPCSSEKWIQANTGIGTQCWSDMLADMAKLRTSHDHLQTGLEGLEYMSRSLTGILPLAPAIEVKIISPVNQPDPNYLTEATHAFAYIHVAHVALCKFVMLTNSALARS
jgi:hypothetical protein